ncbi:MAG: electron transfer flavoprotein subunit alpha/FixB family protein [Bryobacteraceae bacterium]
MSVLVVLENRAGSFNRMSFETVAGGSKIAAAFGLPLEGAVLGHGVEALAQQAAALGFSKVHALDHELLASYTADGYTAALEQLIRAAQPQFVLFPHTYQVRDYAPKLATRFVRPLISDVVDIRIDAGLPIFVRQLFQGKLNADVRSTVDPPIFASLQAGAFRAGERGDATATVETFAVALSPADIRIKAEEPFREAQRSVDLSAADIIVSVGRGIKEKENLTIVEELAGVLGAELAASRPICDNGWLPMERQVGSSGQTVAPKMYVAVGISGAIQHLVGMKGAKTIVAINSDANAPIFEVADYGVVGDLFQVVPALVEQIKKVKAII